MSCILVVDDDANIVSAFQQMLTDEGHTVHTAGRGEAALSFLEHDRPDLIIMDIRMPGIGGLETLRRIKASHSKLPVIIMTGYATADAAIEATKMGAFDYQLKPLEPEEILRSIHNALNSVRLMNGPVQLDLEENPAGGDDVIIGHSRSMQEVFKAIGRVAETDTTVLIRGETGTGKELVARAIYQHSRRAHVPLVVVNCAAVQESLLESEFFGFEKGSFTGAEKRRIGKFEQANRGTIFLDEIGEMSLGMQVKFLRVLQEQTVERIGGNETLTVDVRVIAATSRILQQDIAQGRFREDLYHRLCVFAIDLPALRNRREDIPRLVAYFLRKFARELAIELPSVAPEAMEILCAHDWPGNVRELQHCIQRTIILTNGYPVHASDIQRALDVAAPRPPAIAGQPAAAEAESVKCRNLVQAYMKSYRGAALHTAFLEMMEKLLLAEALEQAHGNQTQAAKLLGIARPTLKAKLDKYKPTQGGA
jgi:DNA-binding NtrC family response regulator